ncbi:MAG: NOP58 family protein [Candidatus Marsarchaeota archaeon]|nr:NOP58 family protein [Candidatus Marsarchaeota archaeon]MCL5413163.1 NOP58 family protein [Candidatus Marsarchaeota archaeon]
MKKESPEEKRERLLNLARESLSAAYSGDEHSVIQAIASFNELEKTRNLIHEKLEEWYGIFFPELRLANQTTYAKFVIEFGSDKKNADIEAVRKLLGGSADSVADIAKSSIGREPSPEEFEMLKGVAALEVQVADAQAKLDDYLDHTTKRLMPNITYLIDYKVAAELLGRAGSLSKLANMPAGTVQLLGAEKALFKHIKFGTRPPKYGVIFKLQQITTANRRNKGKIARIYGTKLAIAARADAISKNFIADKLKEQLDAAIKRVEASNPGKDDQEPRQARWDNRGRGDWQRKRQHGRWQNRNRK